MLLREWIVEWCTFTTVSFSSSFHNMISTHPVLFFVKIKKNEKCVVNRRKSISNRSTSFWGIAMRNSQCQARVKKWKIMASRFQLFRNKKPRRCIWTTFLTTSQCRFKINTISLFFAKENKQFFLHRISYRKKCTYVYLQKSNDISKMEQHKQSSSFS